MLLRQTLFRRTLVQQIGITGLGLCVTLGAGCGKKDDKKKTEPAVEVKTAEETRAVKADAVVPPDVIHLSFEGDPGFRVPLKTMSKFESFNRLLPNHLRSAGTWASLKLTMADGTEKLLETPREIFGEADYDLRAAAPGKPGMVLVVLDKESPETKERFGPLAKIHITPTEAANSKAKPFPMVVDGREMIVEPKHLASLKTEAEPRRKHDAWRLPILLESMMPSCAVSSFVVISADESFSVAPEELQQSYLRHNRKGALMFSLGDVGGARAGKRVRGVTRIEMTCGKRSKNK